MLRHASRALAPLLLLAGTAWAHDPITTKLTYTKEIVRIFHKHCAACHREGGGGPFSVMSYESARPWATAIKEEVLARRMPPWGAVKGFGEFEDDRGLSQDEIHLIADWAEGGAPEGDPVYLPARPHVFRPEDEPRSPGRTVTGRLALKGALTLHGLRPETAPRDNTKLTAHLPSGETLPLIWFYGVRPKFIHAYWFRAPVKLPAGTVLRTSSDVAIRLITKPR